MAAEVSAPIAHRTTSNTETAIDKCAADSATSCTRLSGLRLDILQRRAIRGKSTRAERAGNGKKVKVIEPSPKWGVKSTIWRALKTFF